MEPLLIEINKGIKHIQLNQKLILQTAIKVRPPDSIGPSQKLVAILFIKKQVDGIKLKGKFNINSNELSLY